MINIKEYKNLKLQDVATWERAREGKIYSEGSTLIQISATKGDVKYLEEEGEVDKKYAVVIPNKNINSKYLNIVIKRNIQHFISKYQAGLNIQINDLKHIDIQLHNRETQNMIANHTKIMEAEEKNIDKEIEILETIKSRLLRDLFI